MITMINDLGFNEGLMFLQGHYDGEKIVFYELAEESLINILKNINCLKLKKLTVI